MNNIKALNEDIARRATEAEGEAMENFDPEDSRLTDDERRRLAELDGREQVVVTETGPDGRPVEQTMREYAAPLDDRVREVKNLADNTVKLIKTVNDGDIHQSLDEARAQAKDNAIKAFRTLSIVKDEESNLSDEEILGINDRAIRAIQEHFQMSKLDSDEVIAKLGKLGLSQIVRILPEEFVDIYASRSEIAANNHKAKERLITAIGYLTVTGPEMDYLNEYIDKEHRLMNVSKRIMDCQMSFVEALKSEEKMSEIAARATKISEPDNSYWSRFVQTDPKRVHNEYAQRAIIQEEYKDAYIHLQADYLDDPDAMKLIDEQIEECDAKIAVYSSVYRLDTMRHLWNVMVERFGGSNKGGYRNLEREAIEAINRIRRSKVDVPFPSYRPELAKRDRELFDNYMKEFPTMVLNFNSSCVAIADRVDDPKEKEDALSFIIRIDGRMELDVARYLSLMLLILYGRIMKKLSGPDMTKYQAIELDAYFDMYCKLGTDVYLFRDVWTMMRDFVSVCMERWPAPSEKNRKK